MVLSRVSLSNPTKCRSYKLPTHCQFCRARATIRQPQPAVQPTACTHKQGSLVCPLPQHTSNPLSNGPTGTLGPAARLTQKETGHCCVAREVVGVSQQEVPKAAARRPSRASSHSQPRARSWVWLHCSAKSLVFPERIGKTVHTPPLIGSD
jgi:hypothetical protein